MPRLIDAACERSPSSICPRSSLRTATYAVIETATTATATLAAAMSARRRRSDMRRSDISRAGRSPRPAPCAGGGTRPRTRSCAAGSPCRRPGSSTSPEVIAPHALEDRRAREHLPGVGHEELEQQELGARELDRPLTAPDLVRRGVEDEVREAHRGGVRAVGAAQQRAQARLELLQRERLDEVVVGARVEAGDPVVDRVAGGEHEHRRVVARLAQAHADLEPVELGHRDVEHHRVVALSGEAVERFAAVTGQLDVVALEPEGAIQCGPDRGVVVDHEQPHSSSDGSWAPGAGR